MSLTAPFRDKVHTWHTKPYAMGTQELPDLAKGVYIALDGDGAVRYVGSVDRSYRDALRKRMYEHMVTKPATLNWTHIWVIELPDDSPRELVHYVESLAGDVLKPVENKRLPKQARTKSAR